MTTSGEISVDEVETDDENIQRASNVTVTALDALHQAVAQHDGAILDSIELEEKDGSLYWEVELKDAQEQDIELNIDAGSSQ